MSEECRKAPEGQALKFSPKTKARQKKRRNLISVMVTWTPAHQLDTLNTITYTDRDFFCALYDRDKRRKTQLPVVDQETPAAVTPPRRYQVILDDEDS